ncbi:MAG: aminomethyl-transferring glycine dehydrogenase subunit GcvPA [Gammaproteobacteria bacterium]|nr:aminomethyl-transferring glycine dehydrogenase subunit GcvPA [Gammaproteobacteria bacterium]
MPFIPHTEAEVKEMLSTIGADSIEDLFDEIPNELRAEEIKDFLPGLNEMSVTRLMQQRANEDGQALCFLGAGAYLHHIPAAIWQITTRGEFYSAYTPYQAEASQGTLQLIYEFQSMMTALTGMDVSNASMYDGATALAEAVLMSVRANRKSKSRKILMPATVNPAYRKVTHTLVRNQKIECPELSYDATKGITALDSFAAYDDEDITAVVIPYPNFFGGIEDVDAITDWAHKKKAVVIAVVNPTALALFKAPSEWGEMGADIVIGEGQPLGIPLASGGPYFGFMCCKQALVRQMPGRIVGKTTDLDGKAGFALTLQAREQHIRRSKATSNICTNQGLMVTAATQYMAMLGPQGLKQVAINSHNNLNTLLTKLNALDGVKARFNNTNFHECVVEFSQVDCKSMVNKLAEQNILPGFVLADDYPELSHCILINTTEVHTEEDMDELCDALQAVIQA